MDEWQLACRYWFEENIYCTIAVQYMFFLVEIIKTFLKSCFYTILSDFNNFIYFQVFILHVKYILTYKIIWFYESNHDFNNLEQLNKVLECHNLLFSTLEQRASVEKTKKNFSKGVS